MVRLQDISNEPRVPKLYWGGRTQKCVLLEGRYELVAADEWPQPHEHSLVRESWHGSEQASQSAGNLLIEGDALGALGALSVGDEGMGLVPIKLAYLDPPFNTQSAFAEYHDALAPAVWLTMMRDRLELVIPLLSDDGSIWVHCDDRGQAYLRVLMDELMGCDAFVGTVVWQRRYSRDNRPALGPVHDYIHVYSPSGLYWKNVRNRLPRPADQTSWTNQDDDPRGAWSTHSLVAQGGHGTPAQFYSITTPSGRLVTPPHGSCWRVTKERFDSLVEDGRIWFGKHGRNVPRKKVFLTEAKDLVPWSWWPHEEVGHNQESRRELRKLFPDVPPFSTPKPERLIQRVIQIGTDPGDSVLDCFLGSGTTAAVAHKMGRRWIGVEANSSTIQTFALPRLLAVVEGRDAGGVTAALGWQGGGGFWYSRVAGNLARGSDRAVAV
jgi:adenine-specific DNA-methyltransferase